MKNNQPGVTGQQGAILMFTLVILPILILIFLVALEVINHINYSMRMRFSLDNAAVLVAREGPAISEDEAKSVSNNLLFQNIPQRLRSSRLKVASDMGVTPDHDPYKNILGISALIQPGIVSAAVRHISNDALAEYSRVERYYIPQETAISLDASMSMSSNGLYQVVHQSLYDFIRFGYADVIEYTQDNWISLNAYSNVVNIGKKYQDKLISRSSRKISAEWRQVSEDFGYSTTNDMLSDNGPESGGGRGRLGACIDRKQVAGASTLSYLNITNRPPAVDSDKYELLLSTPAEARDIISRIKRNKIPMPENLLPLIHEPVNPKSGQQGVAGYAFCPSMPLIELNNDTKRMRNTIDKYFPTNSTGTDEGILWAWRTLQPSWRDIWDNQALPHDYGKGIEKRIILFSDGMPNEGYGPIRKPNPYPDLLHRACEQMAEKDNMGRVKAKMISILFANNSATFGNSGSKGKFQQAVEYCAKVTGGRVIEVLNDTQLLRRYLNTLSLRQYWVKKIL